MEISEIIREARIKKGMTHQELANYVYVTRQTISKWELGKSVPCFLQALFGEKCKIFLENVASPNWRKLQGLGWQLFCQLHSHCRPYLVVIA